MEKLKGAAYEGDIARVSMLLQCDPMDVNFTGGDGNTALFVASREGHHRNPIQ